MALSYTMNKSTESGTRMLAYIAMGLLTAAGGILATPLATGPYVLFALIATMMMLIKGWGTLQKFGQQTLYARNMLLIAFGGWFFAELISTGINSQHWANLDYPLRFLFGIGVFWIMRSAVIQRIDLFFYSIAASALAAVVISSYQHFVLNIDRVSGWTNNPIYFGNLSILLCIYATIVLVTMRDKLSAQLHFLLTISIPLLVIASFLTASRSSWFGLLGLLVLIDWRRINRPRLVGSILIVASTLALALMLVPKLSSSLRVTEFTQDIQKAMNGDYRSSIGARLQMWKASSLMFSNSPMIGIGSDQFQAEAANLVASGVVDIEMFQGNTIYNQPHSDIMDALVSKGLVGLAAYFLLLILPYRLFRILANTTIVEVKTFAWMGQATIIAFLMFGLTNTTFKIQVYCAVYPLTIAMLAAIALNLSDRNVTSSEDAQDAKRLTKHDQG